METIIFKPCCQPNQGRSDFYSFVLCKYTLLTTTKLALFLCTRKFQGKVYIALDEGLDYYRIYGEKDGTTKEYHHDIAFDGLGDVLDFISVH